MPRSRARGAELSQIIDTIYTELWGAVNILDFSLTDAGTIISDGTPRVIIRNIKST